MKVFAIFLISILSQSFPAAAQVMRPELQRAFQDIFCQNSGEIPQTRELWKLGIYETQLEAAWIHSGDQQHSLIREDLARVAAEQASLKQHGGYAYGICDDQQAWIVSTPAGASPVQMQSQTVRVNLRVWQQHCAQISVSFAKKDFGLPRKILQKASQSAENLEINTALLTAGTLGFSCHPQDRLHSGPELWVLMPIKNASPTSIPGFAAESSDPLQLIPWIQSIRKLHKLGPLQTEIPLLKGLATQLLADFSIRHPRKKLLDERQRLKAKHIKIIGENRVKASNAEDMVWLLWNSPSHRSLLLHKDATSLGFDIASGRQQKLLVLVLAKM